ncbi:MAG: ATP-binding cassette domain-containing protein [Bacteroidales bacterium]|jgi:cell division transport system ATP-binding protein|nr:ATP-binding cassette domain-containing protein [Bacteroidales bacterium]MDD4640602.1 ATP-binding cassette domain-containing protein [Bacteroidales bacterium]
MEDNILIHFDKVDICLEDFIVLKEVSFEIRPGEFVYLIGRVGSGKSSLLKSLYAEIPVLEGEARIYDYDLHKIKRKQVLALRRGLGIVFQDFKLMTDRTVWNNLNFVLKATGWKDKKEIEERIDKVLTQVGMQNKGYKMPHELSGGEQQRIVIARALLNNPRIILADEPTGNLDVETGDAIVQLLHDIQAEGTTVLMTTHNLSFLDKFPGRVFRCDHFRLSEESNTIKMEQL